MGHNQCAIRVAIKRSKAICTVVDQLPLFDTVAHKAHSHNHSFHVFRRPRQDAAAQPRRPAICTQLHNFHKEHPAHGTHILHIDAHCTQMAIAHPTNHHNSPGRAGGPAPRRHCLQRPHYWPGTTHNAHLPGQAHCPRPHSTTHARSTLRPHTTRSNTTSLANLHRQTLQPLQPLQTLQPFKPLLSRRAAS